MKTIEELLKCEPIFEGDFSTEEDVFCQFNCSKPTANDFKMLYASYEDDSGGYGGYASVIYYANGELYEVHGSHCSCYGLEDQWEPETMVLVEIKNRIENGNVPDGLKKLFGY